jgi:hypothetical protein
VGAWLGTGTAEYWEEDTLSSSYEKHRRRQLLTRLIIVYFKTTMC